MAPEPPPPPRTVKPRRTPDPDAIALPLIVVDATQGSALIERTGECVTDSESIPHIFAREPASLVIAPNAPQLLLKLDRFFDGNPEWQFRVSEQRTEVYGPDREKRNYVRFNTVVSWFGFRDQKAKRSRYYSPLEPSLFAGRTIAELRGTDGDELVRLLSWGESVRAFMLKHSLLPRPSKGGLAVQLLRDHRFYPDTRRKIPAATNAKARDRLPGNHYRLYAEGTPNGKPVSVESGRNRGWAVTYIDQRAAHHNAAKDIAFPDANSLHGLGMFRSLKDRPFAHEGTERFRRLLKCHGMLYVRLAVPPSCCAKGIFPPPYMETPGSHLVFIYTNELPLIEALGGRIEYIIAGWISSKRESGLNKYAEFALRELDETPAADRVWVKPTLLTVYGILATRPRPMEFGWKHAKNGIPGEYLAGAETIKVQITRTSKELEPGIVNVIHRGMIEAETRARTLQLAAELTAAGQTVLAIYADAVMIESAGRLPLLPPPWRVEKHCTDLVFHGPSMFHSRELSKLPGVPREHQEETVKRLIRDAKRRDIGYT